MYLGVHPFKRGRKCCGVPQQRGLGQKPWGKLVHACYHTDSSAISGQSAPRNPSPSLCDTLDNSSWVPATGTSSLTHDTESRSPSCPPHSPRSCRAASSRGEPEAGHSFPPLCSLPYAESGPQSLNLSLVLQSTTGAYFSLPLLPSMSLAVTSC